MDAVVFLLLSVVIAWRVMEGGDVEVGKSKVVVEPEDTINRTAKLNDTFYEDPNAFMEIASALGFSRGGN